MGARIFPSYTSAPVAPPGDARDTGHGVSLSMAVKSEIPVNMILTL